MGTPAKKKSKKRFRKRSKRKSNTFRKSSFNDENKYLATIPSSKHQYSQNTTMKDGQKRVQSQGQAPVTISTKKSLPTSDQGRQYKLKGLMMGPHDPNLKCQLPKARNS